MKKELCIENFEGALIAQELGYDSIELNSALCLGGLTPSLGLVRKVSENVDLEIICMIRNRACGFNYSDLEYEEMLSELDVFLDENIAGIVFGFLTSDFKIDVEKTLKFVEKIHSRNKIAVFHRAIDNIENYEDGIKTLIDLKVDRVLTSGQEETAIEGIEKLKNIQLKYGNSIEIIAGSGLNSSNVEEFVSKTNINYLHSTCKEFREDITTANKVSYSIYSDKTNSFQVTSYEEAKKFAEVIDK